MYNLLKFGLYQPSIKIDWMKDGGVEMDYIVLLRGVNVGGKRKVTMSDLKKQLSDVGFEK